jgi:hypothetical protein
MDAINPQILPSTLTRKEHHRSAIVGVWILVVTLLVAVIYIMQVINMNQPAPPVSEVKGQNDAILYSLRSSNASVSAEQSSIIMKKLSQTTAIPSKEEKSSVLEQLKQ